MTFLPPAFDWPVQFCATVTGLCYVVSIITSNFSQVDRVWTFLPTIYAAYYALLPLWPNEPPFFLAPYAPKSLGHSVLKDLSPRAVLMLALVIVWMFRLSYNTYRRGLFSLQSEDYRWAVLRSQVPAWLFHILNLTFIAITQNVLLFLLGIPVFIASVLQPHTDLSTSDYILAFIALSILTLEFIADNQQFAFQTYKCAYQAHINGRKTAPPYLEREQWSLSKLDWSPSDMRRGFVTKGLWRFSRHPNFACEQGFWWILTLFPLLAFSPPDPPSLKVLADPLLQLNALCVYFGSIVLLFLPALALSLLFFCSTKFTEAITKKKYPVAYSAYQERVGMFLPFKALFTERTGDKDKERLDKLIWGEFFYGDGTSKKEK